MIDPLFGLATVGLVITVLTVIVPQGLGISSIVTLAESRQPASLVTNNLCVVFPARPVKVPLACGMPLSRLNIKPVPPLAVATIEPFGVPPATSPVAT